MSDNDRTKRCRAYLDAIFEDVDREKPVLGDNPIHHPGTWENWLAECRVIDSKACPNVKRDAGRWFGKVVQRALLRIDDIAIARRQSEPEDVEALGKTWAQECSRDAIELISVKWGSKDEISTKLERQCRQACLDNGIVPDGHFDGEDYEIFGGGYSRTPALAVFPCYMTASRRRCWDVIQFGMQKRLALVGTEGALEKFGLSEREMRGLDDETVWQQGGVCANKFRSAITELDLRSKRRPEWYYFGIGHAAFQIALEVVNGATAHGKLRSVLTDYSSNPWVKKAENELWVRKTEHDFEEDKKEMEVKTVLIKRLRMLRELLALGEPLLLSDMGVTELELLRTVDGEKENSNIRWVAFDHGLKVPVGLGFSLCAVPIFLKHPGVLKALATGLADSVCDKTDMEFFDRRGVDCGETTYGELMLAVCGRTIKWKGSEELKKLTDLIERGKKRLNNSGLVGELEQRKDAYAQQPPGKSERECIVWACKEPVDSLEKYLGQKYDAKELLRIDALLTLLERLGE